MGRRFVWSVDWPWLLVLWPVLLLEALIKWGVWTFTATVRFTIWFYRWLFVPKESRWQQRSRSSR